MMKAHALPKSLFTKYYKALCYYAWDMVQDTAQAEDLVQDAFLAYWNHRTEIAQNELQIKSFLYTSIRHAAYNLHRRDKVVEKYVQRQDLSEVDETHFEQQIMMAEFMAELYRIVGDLPPACQNVFRLSYLDGLSNQEVASELSVSVHTIKTQKQRALKVIRQKLNPELFGIFITIYLS
ncbi:MAG: RNA polymerase sigma-70 factor [Sphingobacterium sp.]